MAADRKHILVVEDEQDIVDLLNYHLSREGFAVSVAMTGEDCLNSVLQKRPDLILLDIMLPGMSGLDVCRKLKRESKTAGIQIIIISAKGEESDVVTGFELGADDYITKPFSVKILISRIRTTLRRANSQTGYTQKSELHLRDLDICPNRFQVVAYGKPVDGLTLMEFKLLHLLASHSGWVLTRHQILDSVRGEEVAVTERAVDVQMVGLRKKLGRLSVRIEAVRGVGYRFKES